MYKIIFWNSLSIPATTENFPLAVYELPFDNVEAAEEFVKTRKANFGVEKGCRYKITFIKE